MYIETERTIVRRFTMEDVVALHEIFGDTDVMENVEPPYDLEKTADFLRDFCIGRNGALACVHKASGKMMGYILFKDMEADVYEIGWIFNKHYWRQGYAYEACTALVKYAFHQMNAHKIFAEAIDGVKSVGLMKKLGMKLEGIQKSQTRNNEGNWADLYFYGLLREDYLR